MKAEDFIGIDLVATKATKVGHIIDGEATIVTVKPVQWAVEKAYVKGNDIHLLSVDEYGMNKFITQIVTDGENIINRVDYIYPQEEIDKIFEAFVKGNEKLKNDNQRT